MWGEKKPVPGPPSRPAAIPEPPKTYVASTPAPPVEAKTMSPSEPVFPAAGSDRAAARLGPGLHFKGEITGNEDLYLDGNVEGLVHLEDRKLVVGASAKITADVIAREVVVFGNVKGNLRAKDRIEIKKDGSVVGDLTTARIMIEDGAYFKGSIEIEKAGEAGKDDKPAFTRAVTRSAASTTSD
jgi:cytoskeletal protein CcmA (bactofilin family)